MIKLVVTDIDGTLLPEGTDRMPPRLYEIVRQLKERGILFAEPAEGSMPACFTYLSPSPRI